MEDHRDPEIEDEESIATLARKLSDVVMTKKNLTVEDYKALSDFANQLMNMAVSPKTEDSMESNLMEIQSKILRYKTNQAPLSDILDAVEETQKFIIMLESTGISDTSDGVETLQKARSVLQTAMETIEEEFRHILEQNKHSYGVEKLFPANGEDSGDLRSVDSIGSSTCRDSVGWSSEELGVSVINQSSVSDLKAIVNSMFLSSYDLECCNAYIAIRRYCLEDCLLLLGIEKVGMEEVRKLEWKSLYSKMKKWARGMKSYVRSCLVGEKLLARTLFVNHGDAYLKCFCEIVGPTMFQMLSFGEAVSIGPHQPEKLDPMLHMYEVLGELLADVESLFADEIGTCFHARYRELTKTLGEAIVAGFKDFEKAVAQCDPSLPRARGGIHPVTSYVMNLLEFLVHYQTSLDVLLAENGQDGSSPMGRQFLAIASNLLANLSDQAKGYKEPSLQHIFLMNNVYHVVKKVQNTDDLSLHGVFGSSWIRKQIALYQKHALEYERAAWPNVLTVLNDEGGSPTNSKGNLKEKFRRFNAGFEEIYRTQTEWIIPDETLREEVRISLSINVIQKYRMFLIGCRNQVSENHVKYTADVLESLLGDFFEGTERTLPSPRIEDMSGRRSFFKRHMFH